MALKKNEKRLVGGVSIAASVAIMMLFAMPQLDAWMAGNNQVNALKEEIKNLGAQQTALQSQISLLERNTDIPAGVTIRTYTEENREQIIKFMLDQVVSLAMGAGNRFISLKPSEVDPMIAPPPPPAKGAAGAVATTTTTQTPSSSTTTVPNTTSTSTTPGSTDASAPTPVLTTFGYDLAVRGSYDTLQRFLRIIGQQKELMEIVSMTIDNEAAAEKGGGTTKAVDPNHPLKLTAHLRLAMQPE
jgi:hypothetical protein